MADFEADVTDYDSGFGAEPHDPTSTQPPTDKINGVDLQHSATKRKDRKSGSGSDDSVFSNEDDANETLCDAPNSRIEDTDRSVSDATDTAIRTRTNESVQHHSSSAGVTSASGADLDQKVLKDFLSLISG